jgi:hypothetical protein
MRPHPVSPARLAMPAILALALAVPRPASSASCPTNSLFQPNSQYEAGNFPVSIASGDFNSDGVQDFAVTNLNNNTVMVFLGIPGGSFPAQGTYAAGSQPRGIAAADVNGDGILDLVVTDIGGTVGILLGQGSAGHGNGTFAPLVSYPAGAQNRGVAVVDVNHDGHPDIVCAGRTSRPATSTATAWWIWWPRARPACG